MFIGHIAVGFAARRAAPRTSLAWLMAAPILLDLLWPIFVLLGWEHFRIEPGNTKFTPLAFDSYPWSHSLLMSAVWATLMAALYYGLKKERSGVVAIWLGVVSHWVLDFVTHRPDMPLYPGGPVFGLGLWNHVAATMIVEFTMLAGAVWLYSRETRARDGVGRWAFLGFVGFMVLAYLGNVTSPPPPSPQAIAYVGLATWLFVAWAGWFDGHREGKLA